MAFDTRTHTLSIHGVMRALIAAIVASAVVVTLAATPAAAASKECQVKRLASGKTYSRLQPAVKASRSGNRLVVRGTCRGSTVINKSLIIAGKRSTRGKAILDGGRKSRVLKIKADVKVTISSLTIQNGRAGRRPGGAIINRGKLQLFAVTVRRSRTNGLGGGIYNDGNLQLTSSSLIKGNQAVQGGGVYNKGTLRLSGTSRVNGNKAEEGAGVYNTGSVTVREISKIGSNRTLRDGSGGGVLNQGDLTLNGRGSIRNNTANFAGGVSNVGGTLTMVDASVISGNSAQSAGGVSNDPTSTLTMSGSSKIRENSALDVGGLVNAGTIDGVGCAPATQANVIDNTPVDCLLQ